MQPAHERYLSDAQRLDEAKALFLSSLRRVFGATRWHVRQACEQPGTCAAAAELAEARGWNVASPTHMGRLLNEMRRAGAPLIRERRGGTTFWRVSTPFDSSSEGSARVVLSPPGKRPSARFISAQK